jgi:uncharacterized protein (UPF0248 family)
MRKSRELLLRIYHDPRCRFSRVRVCYIDRGAPGDESCVDGDRIRGLDSQYMEVDSAVGMSPIPYHRITRVIYDGKPVWERGSRKEATKGTGG